MVPAASKLLCNGCPFTCSTIGDTAPLIVHARVTHCPNKMACASAVRELMIAAQPSSR